MAEGGGLFRRIGEPLEGVRQPVDLGHREGASGDRVRERDQLDDREVFQAQEGDRRDHPSPRRGVGAARDADEGARAGHRRSQRRRRDQPGRSGRRSSSRRRTSSTRTIGELKTDLDTASKDADCAKASLMSVQSEIKKLKAEKDNMLAKMATRAGAHPHQRAARGAVRRRRGEGARQRARAHQEHHRRGQPRRPS